MLRTVYLLVIFLASSAPQLAVISNAVENDLFFNGQNLDGWTLEHGKPITAGWEVVDGTIHFDPKQRAKSGRRTGFILTKREFQDFDLSFEWKITKGGNSGLKYRVRSYNGRTRGLEYQICDDKDQPMHETLRKSTGAIYDLYEPRNANTLILPVGEFNKSRIVVQNNHIQHWLNGHLIVSADVGSPEWKHRVATSKFSDLKDFGLNQSGKIMLTDHGSEVWYRNFHLREIPSDSATTSP